MTKIVKTIWKMTKIVKNLKQMTKFYQNCLKKKKASFPASQIQLTENGRLVRKMTVWALGFKNAMASEKYFQLNTFGQPKIT